jgi:hypothetical protein
MAGVRQLQYTATAFNLNICQLPRSSEPSEGKNSCCGFFWGLAAPLLASKRPPCNLGTEFNTEAVPSVSRAQRRPANCGGESADSASPKVRISDFVRIPGSEL